MLLYYSVKNKFWAGSYRAFICLFVLNYFIPPSVSYAPHPNSLVMGRAEAVLIFLNWDLL